MKRRFTTLLLGSISIFALTAPAFAAGDSVEEVVVTASKRPEALKNVPMSVSVISGDSLDKLNARGFEDLLSTVPGFSINEANPTHPDLTLRGINSGGVGTTVGSYIDESPFGSSNALANGAILSPNFDTYDMARVEILRGPQGTLYGSSTEGGLLKFVTNAPDLSGFDASLEAGVSDMDHGGTGESVRGMVNMPITDNLAVRAVYTYQRTPGYIDNTFTGANHTNDLKSRSGRFEALWQLSSNFSVRFNLIAQDLNSGNNASEDVVLTPNSFHVKYGDYKEQRVSNEPGGVRYYLYNTTVNWDLGWATLTSASSFGLLHDYSVQDATAAYGADVQGFVHQGKFTQELRLASAPDQGPFDWLVGGYYTNETSSLHQDIVTSFHGPLIFPGADLQVDSNYNEKAVFGTATYHFTPALDVSAGGRYSSNSQHAYQFAGSPLLQPAPEHGASSGDVFTWSGDIRYHFDEDTMIYGRVAKGFRPGGPNVLPVGGVVGVPDFYGSDSLIDYEVGVKGDIPSANLSFDADVFLINWKNIQLLTVVNGTGVNVNGGGARSQGFEGNVTWTPIDHLTLNLNGAYTDAHLTEDTDALLTDGKDGNPLPWSPKWSAALSGDYRFDTMGEFTPYVGATLHYVGIRHSDFTGLIYQGAYGIPRAQYAIPSYTTVDLRAGVDWQNWELEVYAKNLGSAKGITGFAPYSDSIASAYISPAGPIGAANVTVIQPRVVGLVLRWKY